MVQEKIHVGKVHCGAWDVHRTPSIWVSGKWQAFMEADVPDALLLRKIQGRIRHLLVIQSPSVNALGWRPTGVALPRVHFYLVELRVHVLKILLTQVGREIAVADDPRRTGKLINQRAALEEHVGRKNIRFFRRTGQRAEGNNVGFAVEKNLLDIVL